MNFENEQNNVKGSDGILDIPEDFIETEEGVAFGEVAPIDRLQNQIRLAKDLFEEINGEIDHEKFHQDMDFRNGIMNFWSEGGNSSYSAAYRRLEDSDWFKKHPSLLGDIFKITPQYLLDFIEAEKNSFK
jgi:hypothetical protein